MAATLLGSVAALFVLGGCGGETGGAPTGIAGALTNATIKVSSFSLTASSAVNQLVPVNGVPLDSSVERVGGSLYPTRNSKSFRVVLKGSGVDREDVEFYCDIFDRDLAYTDHTPTPSEPYDKFRSDATGPRRKLVETQLRNLWFAQPADPSDPTRIDETAEQVVPVVKAVGGRAESGFIYQDTLEPVPTVNQGGQQVQPVYKIQDAYLYSQFKDKKAVRVGRRNVIVQFFNEGSVAVAEHYREQAANTDPVDAAADETGYLSDHLTNTYIFTTEVRPNQEIDLTSGFQTNNGDNGLVDNGDLPITVTDLPQGTRSVKFQVFEEANSLSGGGIVYNSTVNVAAGETSKTITIRYANRQRVMKVYATAYDRDEGLGIVLAQTAEDGRTYNVPNGNGAANEYPILFIPTVQAEIGNVFDPEGGVGTTTASSLLSSMRLRPAITALRPSIGTVGEFLPAQTPTVVVDYDVFVWYALLGAPTNGVYSTTQTGTPQSNDVFDFAKVTTPTGLPNGITQGRTLLLDAITAPNTQGTVAWNITSPPIEFSRSTYADPPIAVLRVSATPTVFAFLPVPLAPNRGDTGGVIRGGVPR